MKDDLRPEYELDYRNDRLNRFAGRCKESIAQLRDLGHENARLNRFAGRCKGQRFVITLDPDVSEVFTTAESVNRVPRALIGAMPPMGKEDRTHR